MVGGICRGMRKNDSSSSSQSRVSRFISMVRLAFVGSVTCTPPLTPPVRFQMTHVSVLPKTASPRSAASRTTPSTFSRIHWIFAAEKYVAGGRPALRRMTPPRSSRSSALAIRSVRVSCQTMAL